MASGLNFATMPSHLLHLLFAPLDIVDVLAASGVCRAWHRAAIEARIWAARLAEVLREPLETSPSASLSRRFGGRSLRDVCLISMLLRKRYYSWIVVPGQVELLTHLPLGFDVLRHIEPTSRNVLRFLPMLWCAGEKTLAVMAATCRTDNKRCARAPCVR